MVRINPKTGLLAQSGDKNVILEAYKPGTEPTDRPGDVVGGAGITLDNGDVTPGAGADNDEESDTPVQTQTQAAPRGGTGGLY
jgi:penicillin-binding protein 1A